LAELSWLSLFAANITDCCSHCCCAAAMAILLAIKAFWQKSGILTIIELSVFVLKNILKTVNDSDLHCN
jgi:hypothetical protein